MGIYVKALIIVLLLFPLIAVLSYIRFKKQNRAGRELLTVRTAAGTDHISISKPFCATRNKKWCRVRAVFTFIPAGKLMPANGHPYTLQLSDENNRVLFSEQRSMSDFLGFCWHPISEPLKSRLPHPICDTVLLEFIPPWPGTYTLSFSMKTAETCSTIQALSLEVREDVWPLKKKPYVHTCIDLRKTTSVSGESA